MSHHNPEHIPQPLERDPIGLVENIFAIPGTNTPDYYSQDIMEEFLIDRFNPDPGPTIRPILVETGKTRPSISREVVGWRYGTSYERDGWLIHPVVAVAGMVAITGASVARPAMLDLADEAKVSAHTVYRYFDPLDVDVTLEPQEITHTGSTDTINVDVGASNQPGSAEVDQSAINRFKQAVVVKVNRGGKVVDVTVVGRSSDEYGTNDSIGRKESPSQDFADERADAYRAALIKQLPQYDIESVVDQSVLSPSEKRQALRTAEQAGFTGQDNIIDLIKSVNAGEQPVEVEDIVNELFTSRRGVTLTANVDMPGETETTTIPIPVLTVEKDNPPKDPNRDYDPIFVPIPPIPRWRRIRDVIKPIKRFKIRPGKPIYKPELLIEQPDFAWEYIRKEAIQNGEFVKTPWAYMPKYEHLMRDGKITDVLRADWSVASGDQKDGLDNDKKSLRIMFVKKSPAQETIDEFSGLLEKFAAMQQGKIAGRISGIFVYMSEDATLSHGNPKRIGLGGRKQSEGSILGTYTPALDLVELHMPSTWDPAELEELFADFYGPKWTIAHEVGGHGTDDTDAKIAIRSARVPGKPNAYVMGKQPWAFRIGRLHKSLRSLPQFRTSARKKSDPVQFDISYTKQDRNGNMVTFTDTVDEYDPRLVHADDVTIVGRKPTAYSAHSELEHYAETAAGVITGIEIPYDQADVVVPQAITDNGQPASFAIGYHPDARAQRLFTDAVGADAESIPVSFTKAPEVTVSHIAAVNDPLIREHTIRARTNRSVPTRNLAQIYTQITHRNAATK